MGAPFFSLIGMDFEQARQWLMEKEQDFIVHDDLLNGSAIVLDELEIFANKSGHVYSMASRRHWSSCFEKNNRRVQKCFDLLTNTAAPLLSEIVGNNDYQIIPYSQVAFADDNEGCVYEASITSLIILQLFFEEELCIYFKVTDKTL